MSNVTYPWYAKGGVFRTREDVPDLSTREGFIEAIVTAGNYIADHAGNILGEYPSLLCELSITANFRFDELPTIDVRRSHISCRPGIYPQNDASGDTLEAVARDMYQEIIECDEKHPDEVPDANEEGKMYGQRLRKLGVVV